jgi:hypothetical protein
MTSACLPNGILMTYECLPNDILMISERLPNQHLMHPLDRREDGSALHLIDLASAELNEIRQISPSCMATLRVPVPPQLEARCHGAEVRS